MLKKLVVAGIIFALSICIAYEVTSPGELYSAKYVATPASIPAVVSRGFEKQSIVWHRIDIVIDRRALTTTRAMETTFWTEFTDCRGHEFYAGHVLVGSQDIFQIANLDHQHYLALLRNNPFKRVNASLYIRDDEYKLSPEHCLAIGGGSMAGYYFKSPKIRIG